MDGSHLGKKKKWRFPSSKALMAGSCIFEPSNNKFQIPSSWVPYAMYDMSTNFISYVRQCTHIWSVWTTDIYEPTVIWLGEWMASEPQASYDTSKILWQFGGCDGWTQRFYFFSIWSIYCGKGDTSPKRSLSSTNIYISYIGLTLHDGFGWGIYSRDDDMDAFVVVASSLPSIGGCFDIKKNCPIWGVVLRVAVSVNHIHFIIKWSRK